MARRKERTQSAAKPAVPNTKGAKPKPINISDLAPGDFTEFDFKKNTLENLLRGLQEVRFIKYNLHANTCATIFAGLCAMDRNQTKTNEELLAEARVILQQLNDLDRQKELDELNKTETK